MKNKNSKKIVVSKKWKKIVAREYGVQYTELSLRSLSPESKFIIPKPFYEQVYIPEDKNEVCYMGEKELSEFVLSLKKKYLEKPKNYNKFENFFIKAGNQYVKTAKKISKTNLSKKNNSELRGIYLDYQKKNLRYAPFIWVQFIINDFFASKAVEIITSKCDKDNKNINELVGIILAPSKKASPAKLIKIATSWKKISMKQKEEMYKNFQWLPCMDIHNKPWTKDEFFSHINGFAKSKEKKILSHSQLTEKIKFTAQEENFINIAKRLSYLKDLKDDFRRQGIFFAQPLFEQIAQRIGGSINDVSYLLQEEIEELLGKNKKLSEIMINERKKGFVIYYNFAKKIRCQSGNDIKMAIKKFGLAPEKEFVKEIKGKPASTGKAKGKVVIAKSVSDLNKVKKGDILVAITTHPDYVPAMQKARAIVTDEGGITCHAAIVSRELKKPCIVGTRIATKVLKDGDSVEVDANKGIVKILDRK